MKRQNSQRPRSELTWHQNSSVASRGGFGLHSVSIVAEQVPLALSTPRGSHQISMQAWILGSLLRGNKRFGAAVLLLILLFTLSACSRRQSESSPQESSPSISAGQEETAQPETEQPETPDAAANEAILYIGTRDSDFTIYPMTYEGVLTPEILIAGIADLTGWDMTLAEDVITGKGGMSVCFADRSTLFTGPPDPQNEEFFMFSAEQLAQTILDSTQKTLQMGFTGEGGDPDALDIYYYMEGEKPLELPDIGREWPLDQPYAW